MGQSLALALAKPGNPTGTDDLLPSPSDRDGSEAKARKIVKTDNFTGQTNTVDVDKHM